MPFDYAGMQEEVEERAADRYIDRMQARAGEQAEYWINEWFRDITKDMRSLLIEGMFLGQSKAEDID